MGGFFGPEIRFAGYDGIVITGKANEACFIVIDDDKVEIRDAKKFRGMRTDAFDRAILTELGDRRFKTGYIGPAGENLVRYASIIHTAARAAGRGGVGCVMGSKNLKAIAVRGSGQPGVADHKRFLAALEKARLALKNSPLTKSCWSRERHGPSSETAMPGPRRSGIIARAHSRRPTKSAAMLQGAMYG